MKYVLGIKRQLENMDWVKNADCGLGIKYGIKITANLIVNEDPAGCKIRTTLVKTVLIGSR